MECFLKVIEIQLWNIFMIETLLIVNNTATLVFLLFFVLFFLTHKHQLAFFYLVREGGVRGICQVHALKSLQEVRLRWCDVNRT